MAIARACRRASRRGGVAPPQRSGHERSQRGSHRFACRDCEAHRGIAAQRIDGPARGRELDEQLREEALEGFEARERREERGVGDLRRGRGFRHRGAPRVPQHQRVVARRPARGRGRLLRGQVDKDAAPLAIVLRRRRRRGGSADSGAGGSPRHAAPKELLKALRVPSRVAR